MLTSRIVSYINGSRKSSLVVKWLISSFILKSSSILERNIKIIYKDIQTKMIDNWQMNQESHLLTTSYLILKHSSILGQNIKISE